MVAASNERRRAGTAPYVVAGDGAAPGPSAKHLALAASIAKGSSADVWRSPRAIKRFLNAFAVRNHRPRCRRRPAGGCPAQALSAGTALSCGVSAVTQLSSGERTTLVAAWEEWGRGERDAPPEGVGTATQLWAGTEP